MNAGLFDYQSIDPDGAYAWISVHHLVQALIIVVIIVVIKAFMPLRFGFSWGDKEIGKRYVIKFTLIFGIGSLATHILMILTNSFEHFTYPLTATNIIGHLSFQFFLSGPSEELIFRAFAITMLAVMIRGKAFKGKISAANIIAAAIFGLAHVNLYFSPFFVSYHPFQIILSIILGIFYGDCYEKTKSMYFPMIMHSISNVIMVSFSIILPLIVAA